MAHSEPTPDSRSALRSLTWGFWLWVPIELAAMVRAVRADAPIDPLATTASTAYWYAQSALSMAAYALLVVGCWLLAGSHALPRSARTLSMTAFVLLFVAMACFASLQLTALLRGGDDWSLTVVLGHLYRSAELIGLLVLFGALEQMGGHRARAAEWIGVALLVTAAVVGPFVGYRMLDLQPGVGIQTAFAATWIAVCVLFVRLIARAGRLSARHR